MDGRLPSVTNSNALDRAAVSQSLGALAAAIGAGAIALISPPIALLLLAGLGARALLRAEQATPLNIATLAGPALAACIVGSFVGLAGAVGVLFVWRLQGDVRWSLSEAARLARAHARPAQATWRSLAHGWMTPAYGLALVAFTSPHVIAGLPLDLPHVPVWVPAAAGLAALVVVADWLLRRAADWRLGEVAVAPTIHMLTHHALFLLAFGTMFDLSAGIVALAAWRLAQAAPFKAPQASLTAVP
ncbi:MAG: hypothetical protein JSS00_13240 [Proteobacteria bacterium]|nr:hypothetical protein [Pseudomonadota bacterium]